jgi:hypothetical protein
MKSKAGSVFDAARNVVPVGAVAAEAGPAAAPLTTEKTSAEAPTSRVDECFFDNGVSPFRVSDRRVEQAIGAP